MQMRVRGHAAYFGADLPFAIAAVPPFHHTPCGFADQARPPDRPVVFRRLRRTGCALRGPGRSIKTSCRASFWPPATGVIIRFGLRVLASPSARLWNAVIGILQSSASNEVRPAGVTVLGMVVQTVAVSDPALEALAQAPQLAVGLRAVRPRVDQACVKGQRPVLERGRSPDARPASCGRPRPQSRIRCPTGRQPALRARTRPAPAPSQRSPRRSPQGGTLR